MFQLQTGGITRIKLWPWSTKIRLWLEAHHKILFNLYTFLTVEGKSAREGDPVVTSTFFAVSLLTGSSSIKIDKCK